MGNRQTKEKSDFSLCFVKICNRLDFTRRIARLEDGLLEKQKNLWKPQKKRYHLMYLFFFMHSIWQ